MRRGRWEYGEGVPLPSRLRALGERRKPSQRCPGQSPGQKTVLVHIKRRERTPVKGKLLKIIDKLRKNYVFS